MDFMKKEKIGLDDEFSDKNDPCFDKIGSKMTMKFGNHHDMSPNICMFRKYLLSKTQNNQGKKESKVRRARRPLLPPMFACNIPRRPSSPEQELLPGIRSVDAIKSPGDGKSSASQLTIFYAGAVNVYDNIPVDKARAIMLLAGESSLSKPEAMELAKADMRKPLHQRSLTSVCKLRTDLPLARKISLRHFLEKRRSRIITKASPYSNHSMEHKESEEPTENGGSNSNGEHNISLSPFPSRLGNISPVLANKGR